MFLKIIKFLQLIWFKKSPNIDNLIFKLHYRFTVTILLIFSGLLSARQFFGNPIQCLVKGGITQKAINSYCWISSTYTVTQFYYHKLGEDYAHPGVSSYKKGENQEKYHKYYQWVCIVLFIQAFFFYFPHYLWKALEGGKLKELVNKTLSEAELINYFIKNKHKNNNYIFTFFICEILNLCNIIAQIFFYDLLLGGDFFNYGFYLLAYFNESEMFVDPMASTFPKVTKCTFNSYGPSGTLQTIDALCILPLNIANEKVFFFLWLWFFTLALLTTIWISFEVAVLFSPRLRYFLLRSKNIYISKHAVNLLINEFGIGDWFIIYQLSKNIDSITLINLLDGLKKKVLKE